MVITRDELEELDPKKTRAIEIKDFVDLDEIDPIYFDHPYYLGLDKGAEKAYALLVKAMEDARKVAIARFVLRSKENLAALRPMDGVMTMATMRFADEVVSPTRSRTTRLRGRPRRLEMAKALIDSLAADFDASQYRDEYRDEVLALIERKAKGEKVTAAASEAPSDEGARPDGGARGIAGGGQGRGGEERQPLEARFQERQVSLDLEEQPIAKQGKGRQVEVDGREIALTNLDKVLWPARRGGRGGSKPAFTKGQAIDYYARIADTILPHLAAAR